MDKKIVCFILCIMAIASGMCLFGCKHDTIKFYRESATTTLKNKFNSNTQTTQKKTPGVIILRDEDSNSNINVNFGPRDINFDMPVRIK